MSDKLCFIDSNIWLYFLMIDPSSGRVEEVRKHTLATQVINASNNIISIQVINEVCSVLRRKASFNEKQLTQVIQAFHNRFPVIELNVDMLIHASNLRTQYGFSFWDGLIVASALAANTEVLYSEDMQDELVVSNRLKIVNPFK